MDYTLLSAKKSNTGRDGGASGADVAARGCVLEVPRGPHVGADRLWEEAAQVARGVAVAPACSGELPVRGQAGAPPSCNTGALPTGSVDWLGFSFPDGVQPEDVADLVGLTGWVEMSRGANGYRRGYQRGSVQVLFDGQPGMGVHVEASGKGCRELENAGAVTDWQQFLGNLLEEGAQMSRLDVAFDDQAPAGEEGAIDLEQVVRSIRAGEVVSRYRGFKVDESGELADPGVTGKTVYFGSAKSDTRIRLYDKARQMGVPEHWVRAELQARDGKAHELARMIVNAGVGACAGVLRGLLDFKVPDLADSNRWRWQTAGWWDAFLCSVEKVRLTIAKVARTLEDAYAWMERQVAPTLAVLVEASGGSLKRIGDLVRENRWRLKPHHRQMLAGMAAAPG